MSLDGYFVFNPGTVALEHKEDQPRCCFYRYCGYDSYGQTLVAHTHGLKWFLNLAYSVEKHDQLHGTQQTQAGETAFQTLEPFGKGEDDVRDKYLHGTTCFPSVMFEDTSALPKQYDSYNCGVAVLAATSIILRDLVTGRNNESYERLFNMERLPVRFNMDKDEYYVEVPAGTLLRSDLLNDKSFLSNLKAELYVIFDRLADLEHVTIPKRVDPQAGVDADYLKIKEGLKWPPLPVAKKTRPPADVLERPERFLPEVTQDGDGGEDESTRQWHTHKEHNNFTIGLDEELETTTGEAAQKELERFIKKNKVERKSFTRLLEMEYF